MLTQPAASDQLAAPTPSSGFDVQRALRAVKPVLQANLGSRSEDVVQRLANTLDEATFGAEIQRTASRLRLLVSVQAADQLEQAWRDAQT